MVCTFIKTDNTVAALDIPSNITIKIIEMYKNQCHAEQSFPRSHQFLSYSFNSLSSTQHISSLLFSSQTHSHPLNQFFSTPTFCSHIHFSLNNTGITARMFSALQTQCWHTKITDKKWHTHKSSNPLSNAPISNWHKQHLMKLQPKISPNSSQTTTWVWKKAMSGLKQVCAC